MDQVGIRSVNHNRLRRRAVETSVKTAFLSLLLLFCASLFSGCSKVESKAEHERRPSIQPRLLPQPSASPQPASQTPSSSILPLGSRRLINAESSGEALARRVLETIASADENALKSLRITKQEFCQLVWPELSSSKLPNVTCDFAWEQATLKSLGGISKMLPLHRGKRYELVSMQFAKGTDAYKTYKVHKEAHLIVKGEKGVQQEVRLFGSVLEMSGQFKLFSFVID
jgi:hypothetical protein